MLLVGIIGPRVGLGGIEGSAKSCSPSIASFRMPWQLRNPQIQTKLRLRCSAQASSRRRLTQSDQQSDQQRRAKAASCISKNHEIPERLIIYHAGTGRITFLAMLKLTSLLLGAFFTFLVVPSHVKAEKPVAEIAAVAVAGVIPALFISYTTAPFVTHIHVHLPPGARTSRPVLERFVRAMPASTRLTLTTMSVVAKPRYSSLAVRDLRPSQGTRLGLVNYVRDPRAENLARKWYMYRAVGGFHVQEGLGLGKGKGKGKGKRYEKKGNNKGVEGWIWDAVKDEVRRTRT